MRAIVLLQLHSDRFELLLIESHVLDIRTAKCINTLIIVADRKHRAASHLTIARQELEPSILQGVGILELINQDVFKALLIVCAD